MSVINERLDAITVFIRPENEAPFSNVVKSLKPIVNVRKLMINLRKGVFGGSGKQKLSHSIWSGLREVGQVAPTPFRVCGKTNVVTM